MGDQSSAEAFVVGDSGFSLDMDLRICCPKDIARGLVGITGDLEFAASFIEEVEGVDDSFLRLRWEVDPPAHGLQTVCGRVFNDRTMAARRVRVRVDVRGQQRVVVVGQSSRGPRPRG